jgi:phospho-N-acetylmuramoyl-pentapeptide-transferase
MEIQLLHLFLSAIISLVLYPVWIKFVYRYQMGEDVRSDGPQTHLAKKGTPTMGGLVFVLTVGLVTFLFNRSRDQTLFPLFVASLAGLFGLMEDLSKVYRKSGLPGFFEYHFGSPSLGKLGIVLSRIILKPWMLFTEFWRLVGSKTDVGIQTHQKFLIQAVIAGFVSYWTYFKLGWDYIWFPLIGNVHVGIGYPIFIFLLFIAVLNFVAFTDGLDGLAGGLSFFAICAFWVISTIFGLGSLSAFCATFIGALLPFLYFNIYPARVFMGNVGSHVLGATLVLLGILLHREFALVVILMVFLVDGMSSPLQQLSVKLTGKRVFLMAPLHHHFEILGWPETKVTLRFWLFGIVFAFLGIFVSLL